MLQAAASIQDITPQKPVFLVGYPHVERTSTGVHDPLLASALCMADGPNRILLISLDLIFITAGAARRCRNAIKQATGIPPEHILISATHTHSGPPTVDYLVWKNDPIVPPADPEYLAFVEDKIIQAGIQAATRLQPARLAVTSSQVEGVGCNRLNRQGPMDWEAGILCVYAAASGQPMAVIVVYGMHPTVLHEDSREISSDFPHYTRLAITEKFPGAAVIYHNGPSGNLSPRYDVKAQTFAEAERLGRKLGQSITQTIAAIPPGASVETVILRGKSRLVELPPRQFLSVAEAEKKLVQARETFERLKREKAGHGPVRTAECVVFGAEEALALAHAQEKGLTRNLARQYSPAEAQVLQIGDCFLAGLPCEIFCEYGLEIKRRAPRQAFVISMANGELQGYIVTPEAEAAGGYEAAWALFQAKSGQIMTEAVLSLMKDLG
ncbi:MAG: neutral/alkaline non-lysosomal ceramidase N-terminal domain-containing protein [Verrucomicrobiae bacterium]|nr:neutral/alkaline non-lysosomal ceramidase N-terminal domain-containing protein [Verrucomicrobiae bacterium]